MGFFLKETGYSSKLQIYLSNLHEPVRHAGDPLQVHRDLRRPPMTDGGMTSGIEDTRRYHLQGPPQDPCAMP